MYAASLWIKSLKTTSLAHLKSDPMSTRAKLSKRNGLLHFLGTVGNAEAIKYAGESVLIKI